MQSPDIWGDIPFGNYTYPYDSLLNSPDSLQHVESMRMLRDIYIVNVESSQGANQFIKFCRQISDNWLPSLFSSESFSLKLILLLLLVVGLFILFIPPLKNKIENYKTSVCMTTVSLALILLAVPLGNDYFPTIFLTILGIYLIILFLYLLARQSLLFKKHLFWTSLLIFTIITAFINLSEPIPNLIQVKNNNNPIDNYFLVVSTAFLLFTILAFVFALQKTYSSSESKKYKKQQLSLWALFSWCFAFLLYFIGTYYSGTQRSLLTTLFRPALSASKIFILADSTADITLPLRRSGVFMGMLSLARLSGFLVSTQVIINLLGARLKASIKIRFAHCRNSSLYVFFGINNASINAAKTITKAEGSKPLVVFVDTAEDNISKSQTTFGFGSLMSLFTHKKEAFEAVDKARKGNLPVLLAISSSKLEDISDECNSLSSIGLKQLDRLIDESSKTEFFFLSEDERANIVGAKKLTDLLNKKETKDLKDKKEQKIFCNCQNNNLSQLLQFNGYNIEAVDFAKLAINQLKSDHNRLLSDLLEFDDTGCCHSRLSSLVIGLNEVGEEAINYLYEFGAFVTPQKTRSDFECQVIDSNMHDLEGSLYIRVPELKYREEKRDPNVSVKLLRYKEGSEQFWNWLDQNILSLQFIIISLSNEDLQQMLADEIYNLAVRRRPENPSLPLRIYVCAYTANSANKLDLMAKTYSDLNKYGNVELIPFGMSDMFFEKEIIKNGDNNIEYLNITKYENITKKKMIENANLYYIAYQKTAKQLIGKEKLVTWDERRKNTLSKEMSSPSEDKLASILDLLRKESQDISNEYHRSTKISIIKRALAQHGQQTIQNLYDVLPESLTYDIKADHVSKDDYLNSLIENLAALEHIRWIASHEILGFQYDAHIKKELRSLLRKHPYMVDWEYLTNDLKLFDVAVVITSLLIEKNEEIEKKNNIQSTTD
jgi:hypothetical protein